MNNMREPVLEVKNLKKYFYLDRRSVLKAVDDVSFQIHQGETMGLVGESGCGKTTAGRTIIRLYEPTSGQVLFHGEDVHKLKGKDLKNFRKKAQIVFQNPYASLDPRMNVEDIVGEGIDIHKLYRGKERRERIYELLNLVGLHGEDARRFPHEFSGGQRQRIGIARALAVEPEFIICDEPISALDVSIQSQIINLLMDLQSKLKITYLFISHDLRIVRYVSHQVGVMYLGNLVERAAGDDIYRYPLHPYTQALLSSVMIPDPQRERNRQRILLVGDVPSPINPRPGCPFAKRCPLARSICHEEQPLLKEAAANHLAACHFAGKIS